MLPCIMQGSFSYSWSITLLIFALTFFDRYFTWFSDKCIMNCISTLLLSLDLRLKYSISISVKLHSERRKSSSDFTKVQYLGIFIINTFDCSRSLSAFYWQYSTFRGSLTCVRLQMNYKLYRQYLPLLPYP